MTDNQTHRGGWPAETPATRSTLMFREASEAGEAVARQELAGTALQRIGELLRNRPPRLVITCARGSSDHAATFAKYAIETRLGVPVASAAPSVSSVYASSLRVEGALCIAISQSGRSPDLLATVASLKNAGASVLALVNDVSSPLSDIADEVFGLAAGPERSVAATKSFICTLAAIARLVAAWSKDERMQEALAELPGKLRHAWELDWSPLVDSLPGARDLYVLGRGLGLGIAQEAALKLKETSQIHAEAFSTAELQHGPMALIEPGFPAIIFSQSDKTSELVRQTASSLVERGARVFLAGGQAPHSTYLPSTRISPLLDPILQVQSFYRAANALAVARGLDPDQPPHLRKVTETV